MFLYRRCAAQSVIRKASFVRPVIRESIRPIWCSWRCPNARPTANPVKLPMETEANPRPQSGRWWWKVKAEKKTKQEANLPVKTKIQREIIAWFWVGLAFLLINGTIGQARVIPSGSMENRSEEHTSELQSRLHLVCRLLLEKKKLLTHTTSAT